MRANHTLASVCGLTLLSPFNAIAHSHEGEKLDLKNNLLVVSVNWLTRNHIKYCSVINNTVNLCENLF